MAVSKQEVILEFNADTGQVDKSVVGLEGKIERLADAIEYMAEEFGNVAKSAQEVDEAVEDATATTAEFNDEAKKSGKVLSASADAGVSGFKAVGLALQATGLFGLLTKVLEPILSAFLENKTVAGALSAVMAGLGAVINNVVKVGEKLVGVLVDAFLNPQEALAQITTQVNAFRDRIVEAFESPGELIETAKEKLLSFGDTIKQYVTDKVTALIEGFGLLGKAISQAFSGDFSQALETAGDGLQKIYIEANPVVDATKAVGSAMLTTAKAVGEFAKEALSGSAEAFALDQALGELADRERALSVETARSRAEVEELKRQRDDERLSLERRIELAKEASIIDQRIADENVAIQEEKARLLREEIRLQGETEERLQAVADAEIAVADAKGASAGVQTELMTNIFSLNQEVLAQENEMASLRRGWNTERLEGLEAEKASIEEQFQSELVAIQALRLGEEELEKLREEAKVARDKRIEQAEEMHRQELIDGLQTYFDEADAIIEENAVLSREKELENLRLDHEARIAQAEELGQDTTGLLEAQRIAEDAINAKYDQMELERRQALTQQRFNLAQGALSALQGLNDAFSKDDEESAKKSFDRNKALAIALATVNTGQAVVNALTAGGNPLKLATGAQFVEAGLALATGVAQIATISKTQYTGTGSQGGGESTNIATPSSPGGGSASTAPQLDLSFLGEGATQSQPIQAFVIAQDVSNAQQANQQIQDQATL